jgi:glycosyltransferase involved in cell wall biosynthesis
MGKNVPTNMADLSPRIALVYDRVNKWGGAEAVLTVLHDMFPSAVLYTSVYNSESALWAKIFPDVIPTFLQKLPLARSNHELFPWLTPIAFETLRFNEYDAVISVTSADAKGIITQPQTFHMCYCLTPTRYLWSHFEDYQKQLDPLLAPVTYPIFNHLKKWDLVASRRPDAFVAISNTVKERIQRYYHQESSVVYPPVDIDVYTRPVPPPTIKDFFLYAGRLVSYKRPDVVVNVFNELNLPLVVIGTGKEEKKLKKIAKPHILFKGFVSHEEKIQFFQHCQALIFFHEEDFGIVPVEAQAAGRPVIALNRGGASETVIHGKTGILIDDSSPSALQQAVLQFSPQMFDSNSIREHSRKYSQERFKQEFAKVFNTEWKKYKSIYTF